MTVWGIFAFGRRQTRSSPPGAVQSPMNRILLVVLAGLCALAPSMGVPADQELREKLRHRLEFLHEPGQLVAGDQVLYAAPVLQDLYEQRGWEPIWFDSRDRPLPLQEGLLDAIDLAIRHGLDPDHYHRNALSGYLENMRKATRRRPDRGVLADFELLASDALLTLGHDLVHGRVDPETIDPGWMIQRELPDLLQRLANASEEERIDLVQLLDSLAPRYPEYRALLEGLAMQRDLVGNDHWPPIESGPVIHPGDSDPRLAEIRHRLDLLGDYSGPREPNEFRHPTDYDDHLEAGVRAFQRRHGLEFDGIIGSHTIAALNTSPNQRVDQLRANLERWRWLPRDLGEEYVLVNIAGFSMSVRHKDETVLTQRVVVGTPYRRTPVFTGQMTYLVLNPYWEVPHKLASQDQLPRIRDDIDYLERMGFTVLQGWGAEEQQIDPSEVDWQALSSSNFPFRLRQSPGPENALGQVKFMFPNRHNVYLHDTPARGLFALEERAFSSGCIRVEDPDRLTRWLLNERASILSPEQIAEIQESGRETTVRLDSPLPVHMLYWTAWVDDEGQFQYRRDIYERDASLIDALNASANPDDLVMELRKSIL